MDNFIRPVINMFPTWERDIWNALQKKDWLKVNTEFEDLLLRLENEELEDFPWRELVEGERLMRGEVSEQEWREYMHPILAAALINFVDGSTLADIYAELSLNNLKSLHQAILETIPAESIEAKLEWLKENKPSFYIFLLSSPINGLGLDNFSPIANALPLEELQNHYNNLSFLLKSSIFGYGSSETIQKIGRDFHLSDEKIRTLAAIIGQILAGFVHQDNLAKEIKNRLALEDKITAELSRSLKEIIIEPLQEEISLVYTPVSDIVALRKKETELKPEKKEEKAISLEEIGAPQPPEQEIKVEIKKKPLPPTEDKPFDITQGKPLIIHKEEKQKPVAEEKKFKGFEFPFGIFDKEKERNKTTTSEPVKVKVETPGAERGLPRGLIRKKDEGKRVVHYSELRTPLTPFGRPEEEIIDLQTLTKREPPPKNLRQTTNDLRQTTNDLRQITESKTPEVKKSEPLQQRPPESRPEKPKTPEGPSIEGNIVDLRNAS